MKSVNKPFVKWSLMGFVAGILILAFLGQHALAQTPQTTLPGNLSAAAVPPNSPKMSSAHFALNWNVIGTGGGNIQSSHFKSSNTFGQPTTGHIDSAHYQTCPGFWCGAINFVKRIFLPIILKN